MLFFQKSVDYFLSYDHFVVQLKNFNIGVYENQIMFLKILNQN